MYKLIMLVLDINDHHSVVVIDLPFEEINSVINAMAITGSCLRGVCVYSFATSTLKRFESIFENGLYKAEIIYPERTVDYVTATNVRFLIEYCGRLTKRDGFYVVGYLPDKDALDSGADHHINSNGDELPF